MVKLSELKTELKALDYKVEVIESCDSKILKININENVYISVDASKRGAWINVAIPQKNQYFTIGLYGDDYTIHNTLKWVNSLNSLVKVVVDITIETNNLKPTYDGFKVIE